jgi:hypothetical protein
MKYIYYIFFLFSLLGFSYGFIAHFFGFCEINLKSKLILNIFIIGILININLITLPYVILYYVKKVKLRNIQIRILSKNCPKYIKFVVIGLCIYLLISTFLIIVFGFYNSQLEKKVTLNIEYFPPTLMTIYFIFVGIYYSLIKDRLKLE